MRRCIEQLQPPPKYATVGMLSQIFDLFASAEGMQCAVAERVMTMEQFDVVLATLTPSSRIKRLSNQQISVLPSILLRLVSSPPPRPGVPAFCDGETAMPIQPPKQMLVDWLAAARKDMKRRCSVERSTAARSETPSEEQRVHLEAYATKLDALA